MPPLIAGKVNGILAADNIISHRIREEQRRIFRIATNPLRYGLTLKAIEADSGIPYNTLRSYANGSSMMPVEALHRLCGVIPDELLSLLLPGGRIIVQPGQDACHDSFASKCIDFAAMHMSARHPDSPDGVEISPCEDSALSAERQKMKG